MESVTVNKRPSFLTNKITLAVRDFLPPGGMIYSMFSIAVNTSFGLELRLEDSER